MLRFGGFVLSALLLLVALDSCSKPTTTKNEAQRLLHDHVARQVSHWPSVLSRDLADRISPAPPEVVEYLVRENIRATRSPDAELTKDIASALNNLPAPITKRLRPKLVGIFLVRNLGSSAYTESVIDRAG